MPSPGPPANDCDQAEADLRRREVNVDNAE